MNRRSLALRRALAAVTLLLLAGPAPGEEPPPEDLGALFDVFDAGPEVEEAPAEPSPVAPRRFRFSGSVAVGAGFDFDDRRSSEFHGLAALRTEGRLRLDVELPRDWKLRLGGRAWYDGAYAIRDRNRYGGDVLDAYESEIEIWESWIAGPLAPGLDVKAGRLVTSLGTSETLRVIDLLFPVDNRVPGRADLEDLLLPVATLRVDWTPVAGWDLLGLAFLERRGSELPPPGSGWVPAGPAPPSVHEPGHGAADAELVLAARTRAAGIDLSLVGAWFHRNEPSWRRDAGSPFGLARERDRLAMLGATAVGARGDWVWRAELAGFHGLAFANESGRRERVDLLLGLDWFGLAGSAIAVDVVHRFVPGAPAKLRRAPDFTRRHGTEWALRWRHDLLRDRLHLTFVAVALGADFRDGAIVRLQADYGWSDALSLTGGVLAYASGELPPASALGQNDRFFVEATWRF